MEQLPSQTGCAGALPGAAEEPGRTEEPARPELTRGADDPPAMALLRCDEFTGATDAPDAGLDRNGVMDGEEFAPADDAEGTDDPGRTLAALPWTTHLQH